MTTPEERLAAIAERISACPAPDVLAGYDQCEHGTWPCPATEAAWIALGSDRDTEMHAFAKAVAREAASQYEGETWQEYLAGEVDEAELDCRTRLDAELEAGQ